MSLRVEYQLTLMLILFSFGAIFTVRSQPQPQKIPFDNHWNFHLGNVENAQKTTFDDSDWRTLNLPHDWSIEGKIDKNNPSGHFGGYYPGGVGWYRKTFQLDLSPDQNAMVQFDGVYMNSEVWVNGHFLGKRPNGYVTFQYDLTPYLKQGKNVIAVKVNNDLQPNSRWYSGSGIYRHVWLYVQNNIGIPIWGNYFKTTTLDNQKAEVEIKTKIYNKTDKTNTVQVLNQLFWKNKLVASDSLKVQITSKDTVETGQHFSINNPKPWSPKHPHLYRLVSTVSENGKIKDTHTENVGMRTQRFDADRGFFLNGKHLKIKGVNNHHDAGPVGAAVPEDVLHRRMLLMKKMGVNAIRTSHNPMAPEFYAMADSLGFLVMDEFFDEWIDSWPWEKDKKQVGKVKYGYHLYFKKWHMRDIKDVVLRDRNHPSVFMWSVGNEIPDQCYATGPKRLKPMMKVIHSMDATRPVTAGCCFIHLANKTGFASLLDVTGYNGGGNSVFYEKDRAVYPKRKFIATEIPHSFQTRGVYKTKTYKRQPKQGFPVADLTKKELWPDESKFYNSSYDNAMVRIDARDSWRRTDSLDYVAGEFRWTGFDYLGESIEGWPGRSWNFGVMDLAGFPKDAYYFYQSQWTDKPMVHMLPHWTHPGLEGKKIPVWVYSNADAVELFLNGTSLGKKEVNGAMNLSWMVPYKPGEISAKAYDKDKLVAEQTYRTASKPAKLQVLLDKEKLKADGKSCIHIEVNVQDKKGEFVPAANNEITFEVAGPVKLIGTENGDLLDHTPAKSKEKKAFHGKLLGIIQNNGKKGKATIKISSSGLGQKTISVFAK